MVSVMENITLHHLATIRRTLGLSQTALIHRLGAPFTQSYISDLERGLRPIASDHVDRIAAALDIPVEALGAESIRIDVSSPTGPIVVSVLGSQCAD
jgi:transcriptional regulator with XRE-family HTH domain